MADDVASTPPPVAQSEKDHEPQPQYKEVVVTNFEDGGIVYCASAEGVVYNTEDVYFGVRPARVIGHCVEGRFIPVNPSATVSDDSGSMATKSTESSGAATASASP
jgi:hypothetical protein